MLGQVPVIPRLLGLAGLVPQFACLAAVASGVGEWRWVALAVGWAYAALILSFLGGMWWGLGAARLATGQAVPGWLWFAAVAPSLLALATFLPWVFGSEWPGPALGVLGLALLASPLVDRNLAGPVPPWWLRLRLTLSAGLGGASLVLSFAA